MTRPSAVHVDEGHHDGGLRVGWLRQRIGVPLSRRGGCSVRMLTGVVEGRLISVVAVGDDQLFILKSGGKQVESIRVVDPPDPVQDLVLVGHFDVRRGRRVEQQPFGAEAGVGIQHEDLAKVSAGGAQQVQPIVLWFGESLFVTEDDLLGVIVKFAESQ